MCFNTDLFWTDFYGNRFEYIYLVLVFVTFDISFILLNLYAVKCLHHPYERAYYFRLTLVGLFHECFPCVLPSFEYHFNRFYWLLLLSLFWDSLPYYLAFCGNQLFEFYRNPTDWLLHHAGSGCVKPRNRLLTGFYILSVLVLYFYVTPSRVFFEYVSCKRFRWYLLISIN